MLLITPNPRPGSRYFIIPKKECETVMAAITEQAVTLYYLASVDDERYEVAVFYGNNADTNAFIQGLGYASRTTSSISA